MPKTREERPVVFTDDCWIMSEEPPLTPEIIHEKMIKTHEGIPTSLWWAVGDHEVYYHETKLGEMIGEGIELSELPDKTRRVAANLRHLMETAGGPLTVLSAQCREAGIEFFPRMRMNSHYAYHMPPYVEAFTVEYGKYRQEHTDLLIGRPGEEIPEGTIEWDIRTGKDYAYPEVRDYMYGMITELFERFDVDGVELDFNRHPAVFRREEGYQNRYLMTDLVRRVRERMKEVAAERGREMELAVRVAPTLKDSMRIGLDVPLWMSEGLVDIVTAGMGWIPFEMPIREFVEAAEGTGVQVYGCIEALRPTSDDNAVRALASRFWRAGAGTHLYNFFTLPVEWKRRMLPQLGDPDSLARRDKRYELDHTDRIAYSGHGGAFRNAVPPAQLPVTLHETQTGHGPVLRMDIADDLEAASAEGSLGRCVLGLLLENFSPLDEYEVRINGETYPWTSSRPSSANAGTSWPALAGKRAVEYDIGAPPLRQGVNEVDVQLVSNGNRQTDAPVVTGVEITITYKGGDGS